MVGMEDDRTERFRKRALEAESKARAGARTKSVGLGNYRARLESDGRARGTPSSDEQ